VALLRRIETRGADSLTAEKSCQIPGDFGKRMAESCAASDKPVVQIVFSSASGKKSVTTPPFAIDSSPRCD
jgi:hypothetical protein